MNTIPSMEGEPTCPGKKKLGRSDKVGGFVSKTLNHKRERYGTKKDIMGGGPETSFSKSKLAGMFGTRS